MTSAYFSGNTEEVMLFPWGTSNCGAQCQPANQHYFKKSLFPAVCYFFIKPEMALGVKKTLVSNSKVSRMGQKAVLSFLWELPHPIDKIALSPGIRRALLCSAPQSRKENRSEQMILLLTLGAVFNSSTPPICFLLCIHYISKLRKLSPSHRSDKCFLWCQVFQSLFFCNLNL